MTSIRNARLLQISGLLLSVLVWLANSSNPTNARTGAPFDGHCSSCHNGSNPNGFNGTVEITGMPTDVQANGVYPLTITLTPTAGSPVRGGFQLVAVDGSNANAGNLANGNTQSGTEFSGGREYLEHRGAKNFTGGGPASWAFTWTAPATASGNIIKFYYVGNFGNNNSSDSGDRPIELSSTYNFVPASDPVTATIGGFSNVTCNGGNNGSITVTAGGGTAPYTYAWSNGQTSATAVNLSAGTYTVTVTGASASGTATATKQITQPSAMNVTVSSSGTITCSVASAGVSATASGGTSPYTFQWSNGTTTQQTTYNQPGAYTVTVTDINGCTKTATGSVASNLTAPTAVVVTPPSLTCANTQIALSGSGSSTGANFAYSWTAANGGSIVSGSNTLTPTINNCGTYTLLVTNISNGCTATASKTVVCNTTPPQASATGGTITCNTQQVTLNASSTTPGVTYSWSGPCITPNNQNLQNPVVCAAGTYTVTVTSQTNGCTATATATVTSNTAAPSVSIGSVQEITCANPSVIITAMGSPNMLYSWSGPCFTSSTQTASVTVCAPGVYTVTSTNPVNGCTATASVTVTSNVVAPTVTIATPENLDCLNPTVQLSATGAPSGSITYQWSTVNGNIVSGNASQNSVVDIIGTYRVEVTNPANGCTGEASVNVLETSPVTASASASTALCFGASSGSVAAVPGGGSGLFTYLWSNGSTSAIVPNLPAGTYTVVISDADGCTAMASATVTEPPALELTTVTTAQTALNLNDGTASVTASGGTPGYTYLWSTGATTASINNLAPGSYTTSVTDSNGCAAIQIANVNSFNCNLNASVATTDVSCNGGSDGSATVTVSGATLPVLFQWNNTLQTATVEGLSAGTYMVSLTDAAGCPLVLSAVVDEPAVLTGAATATSETSVGAMDGTATVQVSGGTLPYSYLWNTNATTASISNLAPGAYTATVTDAHNCTKVLTAVVPGVSCALVAEMIVTPVKCFNTASGTASVLVMGATGDLTYQWSTGATTESVENLALGTVTVSVTDALGCSATGTADIIAPASPLEAVAVNITGVPCPLDATGSATPAITGGWGAPYTYQFSWGVGGFNNLSAGIHTFTVTDAEGCSVVAAFNIQVLDTVPPALQCPQNIILCGADLVDYSAPEVTDNCSESPSSAALISGLSSGSAFLDGITTQVFRATDASGNTATCSFTVTVYPLSDIVINSIVHDSNNSGVGSIDVETVGESGPYTYEWRKDGALFANTEDLSGLATGTYTLIATDINGCTVQLAPVFIDNVVGTNNPEDVSAKIKLWPNPTGHAFRLELANIEPSHMEMLNAQGRLVRVLQTGEWNAEISVDELPAGFYYLKIISRTGICQVVKWVRE